MIKKTLHFFDHDGKQHKGDYWFHLSKAELGEQALLEDEGFAGLVERLTKPGAKRKDTIDAFKLIIDMSYGVRDPQDPTIFDKDAKHLKKFKSTEAYSELFMELVTDEDAAGAFIRGIVPSDLSEKLPKTIPSQAVVEHAPRPADYSAMSREDLEEAFRKLREQSENQQG